MIFSSPAYIFLFLPVVFLLWCGFNRIKHGRYVSAMLVVASLFFYGSWSPKYLLLIIGSMGFNYIVSRAIRHSLGKRSSKCWLWLGVVVNLALIGLFKYMDFFLGIANQAMLGDGPFLRYITLPLGISFFTFQQIAYLADTYSGKSRDSDLVEYMLFVTFFPQLIAGPIVHHSEMMPQFSDIGNRELDWGNVAQGMMIFAIGLCKKIILADTFSPWVAAGFDTTSPLGAVAAWHAVLSYTLQIYYDFSGYTDMAIGSALLFNIRLPINFNSPYKSYNVSDFWRRWHITLGRWLRDYLYIPLGGNRHGQIRNLLNLIAVMFLGGLWHGAGWPFIFWGGLHGLALAVHAIWKTLGGRLPVLAAKGVTFAFVLLAWVPFRAVSLEDAIRVWRGMVSMTGLGPDVSFVSWGWVAAGLLIAFFMPNSLEITGYPEKGATLTSHFRRSHGVVLGAVLAIACTWMMASSGTEFIYFNF